MQTNQSESTRIVHSLSSFRQGFLNTPIAAAIIISGLCTVGLFCQGILKGNLFQMLVKQFQNSLVLIRPTTGLYEAVIFHRVGCQFPVVFAEFDQSL